MKSIQKSSTKIAIFENVSIRKIFHGSEWWFVINDVIQVLTDSNDPAQYFKRMKSRDSELKIIMEEGGVQFVPPLRLSVKTSGGTQMMYCWNTSGIFRLIQSIPSTKAEPFKRWLAKVGYERIQEIEDPELATKRTRELYKAKGYSEGWIEKRVRGIAIREELTDEWKNRGAKNNDYAILTAEISKATFDMTPGEYKKYKHLKRENLRDHMTDLELIFSMLGEKATTEITQVNESYAFSELSDDAKEGGKIAGDARKQLEKKTKKKVSTKKNYLIDQEDKKEISQ